MSQKKCALCGETIDGWVYDFQDFSKHFGNVKFGWETIVANQCPSCGAAFCFEKHNKELKVNQAWGVYGVMKVNCPVCGGKFDPLTLVVKREISGGSPKETPSDLFHLFPWARFLLDVGTGERLLAADQPEKARENNFRLMLTDRRLIYLPPQAQMAQTVAQLTNPDNYCQVIPLKSIQTVEAVKSGNGTSLTVRTHDRQAYTFKSVNVPFGDFARQIQQAIPSASPLLTFPEGETLYYDGSNGLDWLSPRDYLAKKAAELHRQLFMGAYRISLAITSQRLVFYRINHIESGSAVSKSMEVKLSAPTLQFISIPWSQIRRVEIDRSFFSEGAGIVMDSPISGWVSDSLRVYPQAGDMLLAEDGRVKKAYPAFGDAGKEWKLPLSLNIKAIDAQVISAMQAACPTLTILETGKKK